MEIKVNDYVRFKNGKIYKVNMVDERNNPLFDLNINGGLYSTRDILKTSPRIIELIEVGDYVNGYKVVDKGKYKYDGNQSYITIDFNIDSDELHWGDAIELTNDEIKSIVTKEQFSQMEYKID